MSHKYFITCANCEQSSDFHNRANKDAEAIASVYQDILKIETHLKEVFPGFYGTLSFDMFHYNDFLQFCREHEGHELWLESEYDGLVKKLTEKEV